MQQFKQSSRRSIRRVHGRTLWVRYASETVTYVPDPTDPNVAHVICFCGIPSFNATRWVQVLLDFEVTEWAHVIGDLVVGARVHIPAAFTLTTADQAELKRSVLRFFKRQGVIDKLPRSTPPLTPEERKARQQAGVAKAMAKRRKEARLKLRQWRRRLKVAEGKVKKYQQKVKRLGVA